jgi:hypothetical protein
MLFIHKSVGTIARGFLDVYTRPFRSMGKKSREINEQFARYLSTETANLQIDITTPSIAKQK